LIAGEKAASPFDNLGLPWRRHFRQNVLEIPAGEAVSQRFDLMPTTNVFNRGHRLRLTVTCLKLSGRKRVPVRNGIRYGRRDGRVVGLQPFLIFPERHFAVIAGSKMGFQADIGFVTKAGLKKTSIRLTFSTTFC